VETNHQKNKSPKKHAKRKQVHLSKKELEELMGVNMPVYVRHKGAIRRK
jgi:hypothetical protein